MRECQAGCVPAACLVETRRRFIPPDERARCGSIDRSRAICARDAAARVKCASRRAVAGGSGVGSRSVGGVHGEDFVELRCERTSALIQPTTWRV
jgi:hypothetical protein